MTFARINEYMSLLNMALRFIFYFYIIILNEIPFIIYFQKKIHEKVLLSLP